AASEGRAVLLSSHLMSEMSQTADHLIVLGKGKVLADAPLNQIVKEWTTQSVRVRSPHARQIGEAVAGEHVSVKHLGNGFLELEGISAEAVGDIAAKRQLTLHELTPTTGTLEDAYMQLTGDQVEYKTKEVR
ncbi:MAG: ABC transporter ATP-binding protein, partial [Agrococcus casei]